MALNSCVFLNLIELHIITVKIFSVSCSENIFAFEFVIKIENLANWYAFFFFLTFYDKILFKYDFSFEIGTTLFEIFLILASIDCKINF